LITRFFVFSVYNFFKILTISYQWVYFSVSKVINKKGLDISGPVIIVSNHPNTLLDPLNVLSRTPRRASLLANASMFKHPFANWFLNHFTIPIHRPGRDNGTRKVNNNESFSRAYEHLAKGGMIYIAPEGSSYMERHLRPIKTGTARISLGAEHENDFKLGIRILPVGVNYEYPNQCNSRMLMKVGQPILVSDWKESYDQNPKQAAKLLTDELQQQMQSLIIHTEDKEQDQLLYRLEKILQTDEPFELIKHHNRTQKLLSGLQYLKTKNTVKYNQLLKKTEQYRHQLKANGITDRGISKGGEKSFTLISILGIPFWLYGRINNYLAIEIPRWLVRKLDLYIGYDSTVKILSGLFTFPISYFLQYKLVQYFFEQSIAWCYLFSLPVSAVIYQAYQVYIAPRVDAWKWRRWKKKHETQADVFLDARTDLKENALLLIAQK